MLHVPRHLIDRLDRKVSVVYLAERAGVKLTAAPGRVDELVGACLLHDGPATLHVLPAVNLFRCEVCRVAGSSIAWVSHFHAVSRQEAARELLAEFFPGDAMELSARHEAWRTAHRRIERLFSRGGAGGRP